MSKLEETVSKLSVLLGDDHLALLYDDGRWMIAEMQERESDGSGIWALDKAAAVNPSIYDLVNVAWKKMGHEKEVTLSCLEWISIRSALSDRLNRMLRMADAGDARAIDSYTQLLDETNTIMQKIGDL